jgi:hypothetical protein
MNANRIYCIFNSQAFTIGSRRFELGVCVRIRHSPASSSSSSSSSSAGNGKGADDEEDAWLAIVEDAWRDAQSRNMVKLRWYDLLMKVYLFILISFACIQYKVLTY